ncbi:unnamed protein product [Closterium sp. Naga37s-1]|nr:unnamed protein product [Closterium sp. Naga37s-1]
MCPAGVKQRGAEGAAGEQQKRVLLGFTIQHPSEMQVPFNPSLGMGTQREHRPAPSKQHAERTGAAAPTRVVHSASTPPICIPLHRTAAKCLYLLPPSCHAPSSLCFLPLVSSLSARHFLLALSIAALVAAFSPAALVAP